MDIAEIKVFEWDDREAREFVCEWNWTNDHTKEFDVHWWYEKYMPSGTKIRFTGSRHNVDGRERIDTFNVPVGAVWLGIEITPKSETYQVNGQEANYWWAYTKMEYRNVTDTFPPDKPDTIQPYIEETNRNVMSVKLNGIRDSDNNKYVDKVEYDIIEITNHNLENESTLNLERKFSNVSDYGTTKFSMNVSAGKSYTMRVRYVNNNGMTSLWGEWSEVIYGPPLAPVIDSSKTRAESMNSIHVEWGAVADATNYEIEYTTNTKFFDSGTGTSSVATDDNKTSIIIAGVDSTVYYLRMRTIVNGQSSSSKSDWSAIVSVGVGIIPNAPTTWTLRNVAYYGEESSIRLYWIHNSADNSHERTAGIYIYKNGMMEKVVTRQKEVDTYKPYDPVSYYDLDISKYPEGTEIEWFVQTRGAYQPSEFDGEENVNGYGDMSVSRKVKIYKKPTLSVSIKSNGELMGIPTITQYPLSFETSVEINEMQKPIGYSVLVLAGESFVYTDSTGRTRTVSKGDVIFNRYTNSNENLDTGIAANEINLAPGKRYILSVTVSMSTGLTSQSDQEFICDFTNYPIDIQSQFLYNKNTESLSINMVATSVDKYGHTTYPDCIMSLYRMNDDGTFVLIAEDIHNDNTNWVVDPHPQLNWASYRVVAKDDFGMNYSKDLPAYPINCKEIILQWDETYTNSENTESESESVGQVNGTLLRLPYNIDWDETADIETNMVKYVGRKDPVAYYGTHTGYTASGSTDIPKSDIETIKMLRRLQIYMGNVYVREPSGTGYWAQVKVKFPQKHCEVIVPVSIDITRVEGGM